MNREPPARWPPKTISSDQDLKQLDCASHDEGGSEDPWISGFIRRLNYAIEDIGRKK
jgi:hypothetical protein